MIFTLIVMNISIKYHQTIYDGRRRKKVNNKKKESAVVPQSGVTWSGVEIYTLNFISIFFFYEIAVVFMTVIRQGTAPSGSCFIIPKKKSDNLLN